MFKFLLAFPHIQTMFTFCTTSHCFLINGNHALENTGQIMEQGGPSELETVPGIQEVTLSHEHTVHAFLVTN